MRIQDGKKLRVIVTEEVAKTIPEVMTYGPRLKVSKEEDCTKVMIFAHSDNFNLAEEMEVFDKPGHIEFTLNGSIDSTIKELFDVADSVMIQIEDFDANDISLFMSKTKHMIVMRTPQNTNHLMYSNVNDITRITTGQFPCEMILTEKNSELIFNDLIAVRDTLVEKCPEKLSKISVLVEL